MSTVLDIRDLSLAFETDEGIVDIVDKVSIQIEAGETHGIVGESGCGKSVTALAVMGLLPKPAGRVTGGEILFHGEDLLTQSSERIQDIRGSRISMIFQEPMTALNPVHRVGKQLMESLRLHQPELSSNSYRDTCIDLLAQVGIPAPDQRMGEYPHQLSGGMRQRVMIAMALLNVPDVLIADEPTTALDVTIQAQILELLLELQQEYGMAIIFITHDLAVIAEIAKQVTVMYAGRVAESAPVGELFRNPMHPYSQGLLNSIPTLEGIPKTQLETIAGMVPSFSDMPSGCRFSNRCDHAVDECTAKVPTLEPTDENHLVACSRWREVREVSAAHHG